jgi:hypothetical protein
MDPEMAPNPSELDALRTENAHLQARLAKAEFEADMFRSAAYEMLDRLDPEQPPSEAEILAIVNGPLDRNLLEIIEEHERQIKE